jgi:hypothetical protein
MPVSQLEAAKKAPGGVIMRPELDIGSILETLSLSGPYIFRWNVACMFHPPFLPGM